MTRASDIRTQNFNQNRSHHLWFKWFSDWLTFMINDLSLEQIIDMLWHWFEHTNNKILNVCMFWWKHEIKNCSCWWIITLTFWSAPTKLNDIDNHHSWSSLQVWMPTNKYRQVDLIFQWNIKPTDRIQHVATCCKMLQNISSITGQCPSWSDFFLSETRYFR